VSDPEAHLDALIRHIGLVRDACIRLGKRLIDHGRPHFGRLLIAHGFAHDASKFYGIEWEYLTTGQDVPPAVRDMAIEHHRQTNSHHPEYWGGFENMPEISVAEMACDLYARSQEFGTDLRQWIRDTGVPRYRIDPACEQLRWLEGFVEALLAKPFAG
jgi:Family of unknown function (DUF5662)